MRRTSILVAVSAMLAGCTAIGAPAIDASIEQPARPAYLNRLPVDEVIYFVIPDRFENGDTSNDLGGIEGTRLEHGYDPAHKGFYHGGDLKGLTARLDYVQGLGATAIWLGPIYQNKAVQGPPGDESAGYHGYWITDFYSVDRHLGTDADMKAFVDGAHVRGMKVYLDIITNHTADVIQYRECTDSSAPGETVENCDYRSLADYPYTTRGGANGEPLNSGFMGDRPPFQTEENFKKLTRSDFAYTPYVPAGEEDVKSPAWLNDVQYYHNRGNTTFEGESSVYGDFVGLDDLMTEDPRVRDGFIEVYKDWISRYRIDGFRIDTARHVNAEFWQAFNPAMVDHAAAIGIPNFHVFGEVYDPDPGSLARYTRVDNYPSVLDFAFQSAVQDVLVSGEAASRFERLFRADDVYAEGAAAMAPTFLGNHDMGRFAGFLRAAHPDMPDEEIRKRVELGHALMFFARGVPVIYYGDEQGFVSDGNDQLARENMFPSQVDVYNDNDLIGTAATTAQSNFDPSHPLYIAIRGMADVYQAHEALRRGTQVQRLAELDGGVFAFSRIDDAGGEYLVVLNTRNEQRDVNIVTDPRSESFDTLVGNCPATPVTTGVVRMGLAPLSYSVCRSAHWKEE